MSALLRASAPALPRRALSLHLVAAAGLLAATWTGLHDERTAVAVLRGVALLLAAALALAVDEAGAALLDASPTALHRRLAARLVLCAAAIAPVWAGSLAVVAWHGAAVPVAGLTLELAALGALGLAAPAALRRWWRVPEPALVTGPLLLGALLLASQLPPGAALLVGAPVDQGWQEAHLRWTLVLVTALGLLLLAVTEPATARGRRRPGHR